MLKVGQCVFMGMLFFAAFLRSAPYCWFTWLSISFHWVTNHLKTGWLKQPKFWLFLTISWVGWVVLLVWTGSAEAPVSGASAGMTVVAGAFLYKAPHPPAGQPGLVHIVVQESLAWLEAAQLFENCVWKSFVISATSFWSKQVIKPSLVSRVGKQKGLQRFRVFFLLLFSVVICHNASSSFFYLFARSVRAQIPVRCMGSKWFESFHI